MVTLVKEVKDALQDMTATLVGLSKVTLGHAKTAPTKSDQGSASELSSEESVRVSRRRKGKGGRREKAARKDEDTSDSDSDEPTKLRKSKGGTKTKWYYAVARGRRPGVYTDWGEAEKQVNGFSGSLHQKFSDKKRAQRFVDKHRSRKHEDTDDESEVSGSGTDGSSEADKKPKGKQKQKKPHHDVGLTYPPLALTAPDPSTGNSKELFKMTLASDKQMTEKLSPPGLDAKTREALADATLDAVQLPGTSLEETADNTGDLVGALREMTEDRRNDWTTTAPRRTLFGRRGAGPPSSRSRPRRTCANGSMKSLVSLKRCSKTKFIGFRPYSPIYIGVRKPFTRGPVAIGSSDLERTR